MPDDQRSAADAAMERYARGEDAAFADLYDAIADRVLGFLLRCTRDHVRAEDLMQQTFLQIVRARGSFAQGARVLPWVFAIARRLSIDEARRDARAPFVDGGNDPPEAASGDASVESELCARQSADRVLAVLAGLPETQRTAYVLLREEGLSVADAAAILDCSPTAVKLRAFRAYEALRSALREDDSGSGNAKAEEAAQGTRRTHT